MKRLVQIVLASLCVATTVHAQTDEVMPKEALDQLRRVVVQHKGRLKPIDSFAWESLDQITDKNRIGKQDPVETLFRMTAQPEYWKDEPLIAIPYAPLRPLLGMEEKQKRISMNEVVDTRKLMRMLPAIVEKQERDDELSMIDNETMDVFNRFVAASNVFDQKWYMIPPAEDHLRTWSAIITPEGLTAEQVMPIREAWSTILVSIRESDTATLIAASKTLRQLLIDAGGSHYPAPWRIEWEVRYNALKPFQWAQVFYGLGALLFLISLVRAGRRWYYLGFLAFGGAFVLHTAGILLRVILGGRPPVSNFYETMLWIPFVMVVMTFILEARHRMRYLAMVASALSGLTLFLADQVPLDSSITPVVAVLRSNKWLTIHVLTIVASYGAIALAAGLAHVYAVVYWLKNEPKQLRDLATWTYRCIQIGVVLLAGGIMLGAVWANASWGRYWAWDPKETWALITLLWYLAILHGRFAGWLRGFGVAMTTICGFFLLLVTYYGVSFYMVGLHSYAGGNAKPLPPMLIGYLIFEGIFMALMFWVYQKRKLSTKP